MIWQKSISFDDFLTVTVGENGSRTIFGSWLKARLWIGWKMLLWVEKVGSYDNKKLIVIVMWNNRPETKTKQQKYLERNKEKCLKKGKRQT